MNLTVQCVVKKGKSLLGCVIKDITRRAKQIKLHCSVLVRTHLKCWVQLQYKEGIQADWKESGEGSPKPVKGLEHLMFEGKLSETGSCSAWRRKVLGSYLCNDMTRGIEKTEPYCFGLGKRARGSWQNL